MAHATPLLNPDDETNEALMVIIGIGTVWLFLGTALFWVLGYAFTPLGFGTALAHALLPTIVTMGGHELAHYLAADEYCRYPEVDFAAFVSTATLTIASLTGALLLVLLDGFGVVSLPKWLLLFGLVSPGAVLAKGTPRVKRCKDEVAVFGPLWNFVIGAAMLFLVFDSTVPFPSPAMGIIDIGLVLTTVLSLVLAFTNSLPIGPMDGNKVWRAQEPATLTLWAVVLMGSAWLLFQPIIT
jgi:Zn-dependent protease